MKKITVTNDMAGQRLDKYLKRILPSCPSGLLYKQLRKKNITLRGSKADGSELIREGDIIEIFFSDETYEKFAASENTDMSRYLNAYKKLGKIDVVCEEDDFIVFNKPSGVLSQSDNSGDYSINDYLIGYMLKNYPECKDSIKISRPSICNRLDRNTSGLIACSKNLAGARFLNSCFQDRNICKYYLALCYGRFDKEGIHSAFVKKNESDNILLFTSSDDPDGMEIKTGFEVLKQTDDVSLLKIRLYTGKSHQIRSHLSKLGFPIIGDPKYGGNKGNYKAGRQMLHAYSLKLEGNEDGTSHYKEMFFKAPMPSDMKEICRLEFGSLEDLNL